MGYLLSDAHGSSATQPPLATPELPKGENERYTHLYAEFHRIARRDKKAFLGDQCKEIEENNRTGKTRTLKKIRAIKGTFHTKVGSKRTEMVWT